MSKGVDFGFPEVALLCVCFFFLAVPPGGRGVEATRKKLIG